MKLSSITLRRLLDAAHIIIMIPPALIARRFRSAVWIVTERPGQARDNGYCFYRYIRECHPEQTVYYIIDKKAKDYQKVVPFGNIIQFNSWKHFFYYCLSTVHISAHVGGCNPGGNSIARRLKKIIGYHDVFLPHGVSYGISEFCLAKYAQIDLFICSGKKEYENVLENYGYTKEQIAYTGFPRLDSWYDFSVNRKLILLMPTWRLYLAQNPHTVFGESVYYKAYHALINSPKLRLFLEENDLKLVFYLHHGMQKYAHAFHTDCSGIEVVYKDETYDIQDLLKESALLITDYSSVHFDFAYMGKPVLYYQFDQEEFRERQYERSNFDTEKDGFGPVAYNLEDLLENLKQMYAEGFMLQSEYEKRMKQFYTLRDRNNCQRVYEEISRRWNPKG